MLWIEREWGEKKCLLVVDVKKFCWVKDKIWVIGFKRGKNSKLKKSNVVICKSSRKSKKS